MTDRSRIYYYSITGACGGLTGWFIATQISIVETSAPQTLTSQLLYGGILGATIGVAVAAYDGIMNRSVRRFIKYGSIGFALGAFAGALALPLAQWIYASLLTANTAGTEGIWQRMLVGTLCWLLFGGLIGFGEGISKGTQSWKGFLGGLIGGLAGGLLYEINRAVTGGGREPFRYQFFLASSLLLLGAAISASIALVTEVLKRAWVEILGGKFTGRSYDVTKYVDARLGSYRSGVVGSDQWSAHIYLPGDHDILPRHAEISFANGAPTLTVLPEASKRAVTFINGRRLANSTPLSNGDELQFGSTKVVYRQKRL
jgi:hypothetical protein